MKNILIAMLCTTSVLCSAQSTPYKESRQVLFSTEKGSPYTLKPDESITKHVEFQSDEPTRKRLRVIGGTQFPGEFAKRGETMFRLSEYFIDDFLDSVKVKNDKYALYFKGNNDNYERSVYHRISGDKIKAGDLLVELPVWRNDLKISGYFGVEIEVFLKKEGRHPLDVYDAPDMVMKVDVPAGTSDYQTVSKKLNMPDNVACILLRVGGTGFSGECRVEAPRLIQGGKVVENIPFDKYRKGLEEFWVGINMVSRNHPTWKVEVDGKQVFYGEVFDRGSDVADFYVPLPESVRSDADIKLTLVKTTPQAAFPYDVHAIEILEESARSFELISVPKYVTAGKKFGVLVETNRPNTQLSINTDSNIISDHKSVTISDTGLNVLQFKALKPAVGGQITITDGVNTYVGSVSQVIGKGDDSVYLSCGDDIYVDKDELAYSQYFKWYIGGRVGSLMQFRPSYQWSGFRVADSAFTRRYVSLLEGLNMPFAWQVEGRTLAGKLINPDTIILSSPMFQGKQAHENDGGYYYWQHFPWLGFYCDIAARNRPYGGIFAKHRPIRNEQGSFIFYDPYARTDMADGARGFVEDLASSRGESTRHTGPSTMFRYLYQAGYTWLGAEQMYGPEEVIMSSLRGASKAYGKTRYGSLHAMQWGSGPYTHPTHAPRFYLSLAVAYMHGSSQINTEDALWVDEYANDRFGDAGKAHMGVQHQILDMIETRERRGELNPQIAVIQGRNDAWKSFGRSPFWSQKGDEWAFGPAGESFDLLNVFYPGNNIDAVGTSDFTKPAGWYSATPYGAVDLLPIEASEEVLNDYKALVFLGWNSYDAADFRRLTNFVKRGGVLIMSGVHLNTELKLDREIQFPADDSVVSELLGDNYRELKGKVERKLGSGKVIFFADKLYPSDTRIRAEYEAAMRDVAAKVVDNELVSGWIVPSESVEFAAWGSDSGRRDIYLLNIDWWSGAAAHQATFTLGSQKFDVNVRAGQIETVCVHNGIGVMAEGNTTDVKSINAKQVVVQTIDNDRIKVFSADNSTPQIFEIKGAGIHNINLK